MVHSLTVYFVCLVLLILQ